MKPISEELYKKIVEISKVKKNSKLTFNISDFPISHKFFYLNKINDIKFRSRFKLEIN